MMFHTSRFFSNSSCIIVHVKHSAKLPLRSTMNGLEFQVHMIENSNLLKSILKYFQIDFVG